MAILGAILEGSGGRSPWEPLNLSRRKEEPFDLSFLCDFTQWVISPKDTEVFSVGKNAWRASRRWQICVTNNSCERNSIEGEIPGHESANKHGGGRQDSRPLCSSKDDDNGYGKLALWMVWSISIDLRGVHNCSNMSYCSWVKKSFQLDSVRTGIMEALRFMVI